MANDFSMDALPPAEMAMKAEAIGVKKATAPTSQLFNLAILAGAYIALGAVFATTVAAGVSGVMPYGLAKLLIGLSFCLGLILVVVGGAELFTGNNLIIIAFAGRKISLRGLLRNWVIVYLGNFVGSIGIAVIMFFARQYTFADGLIGRTALSIANGKLQFDFLQALSLGIMCNILVCLAVWLTFSARTTTDKIAALIFPITAFVAAGFEHSVANMYFIPMGLLIKDFDPGFTSRIAALTNIDFGGMTWGAFFLSNLLPVTIGNMIGGAFLVGCIYWLIFLRRK